MAASLQDSSLRAERSGQRLAVVPKTNEAFWREKIARNIARDELNAQRLDTLAWSFITVWECELGKNTDATIARIEADLRAAKEKYDKSVNTPENRPKCIVKSSPRSKLN